MQIGQTGTARKTHILVVGLTPRQWFEWRGETKGVLQSMQMGWTFSSETSSSASDACERIRDRDELEIVFFSNENAPSIVTSLSDAHIIASAINAHKNKPWVVLDHGLEELKELLEEAGIETRVKSFLQVVIHERWVSQMRK